MLVRQAMTPVRTPAGAPGPRIYCFEDQPADEVGAYMRRYGITRIIMLDRLGREVGLLDFGEEERDRERQGEAEAEVGESSASAGDRSDSEGSAGDRDERGPGERVRGDGRGTQR